MNRDCHGDFYTIGRRRFYRCFLDGSTMKASIVGATCPRCQRTVDGMERGTVQSRTVTSREILLPSIGWVVHTDA